MKYYKVNRKLATMQVQIDALSMERAALEKKYNEVTGVLNSTMHELRRFCAEISADAERLGRVLSNIDGPAVQLCQTINYTSGMILSRLGFTDLELNPSAVSMQTKVRSGIYKKFDKARYILRLRANAKQLSINFEGTSSLTVETLPAFELVPFVILDNAIKYSPGGQTITISFSERATQLDVEVRSVGPYVEPAEAKTIFDRGVRGRNAERLSVGGEGRGLYLAKFLCDYHDIELRARSDAYSQFDMNGIPHAPFALSLRVG